MTAGQPWPSASARATLIVAMLLLSLASAGVLTWQAHDAAASHRASAESVVRDYAALIADEAIRRTATEVGYSGYYTLIAALAQAAGQPAGLTAGTIAALRSAPDERLRHAAGLLRSVFLFQRGDHQLMFLGDPPPPAARAELIAHLAEALATSAPFAVFHGSAGDTFVSASVRGLKEGPIVGFEVDPQALDHWLDTALRAPLLPASLAHGQFSNSSVHVSIHDAAGVERARLGPRHWPELGAVKLFGDVYQGALEGFTVESSIDPAAAADLVIGGLPRSRLPFLIGLLTVIAGLTATAILQLQREMTLTRLRSEFVSSVSHELRTPLTQIRIFAETLLLERIRTKEEHRRALEIIDREARRLTHLVENVLSFSRAEQGLEPRPGEARELVPVLREVLDDFAPLLRGTEIQLVARFDERVRAEVDPDALRQVLLNLLDNAVKYGPRRQRILVALEAAGAKARILVEDEGPGIPEGERERVFERFHRLDREKRAAVAGTGIGLSVVRDLIARSRGSCAVETGARGGARFVIELPAVGEGPARPLAEARR
jgi:signal transduction histidine kinase